MTRRNTPPRCGRRIRRSSRSRRFRIDVPRPIHSARSSARDPRRTSRSRRDERFPATQTVPLNTGTVGHYRDSHHGEILANGKKLLWRRSARVVLESVRGVEMAQGQSLYRCSTCGGPVALSHPACPHCGSRPPNAPESERVQPAGSALERRFPGQSQAPKHGWQRDSWKTARSLPEKAEGQPSGSDPDAGMPAVDHPDGRLEQVETRNGNEWVTSDRPGQVGHHEGNWQSSGFRAAGARAFWAQLLFIAVAAALAWETVLAIQGSQFAHQLAGGVYVPGPQLVAWSDQLDQVGNVYLALAIALAVAFLAWLSRTVDNVPPLLGGTPSDSPRWAIAWWFIPVAFLWKPYTVVRESWDRLATPAHKGGSGLVIGWWICWIGGTVISRVATTLGADPNASYSALETYYAAAAVGLVISIGSALLGVLLIGEMEARARERSVALGLGWPQIPHVAVKPAPPAIIPAGLNLAERLRQLEEAHAGGLISDEELAATRIDLLHRL
jgi:hypothetical protein